MIDYTGQKIGKWSVLSQAEGNDKIKRQAHKKWICQCECGSVNTVTGETLAKGNCKGCARCRRKKDKSGMRFGRLTVIKDTGKTSGANNKTVWLCQCDCGNLVEYHSDMLTDKDWGYRSCGCITTERYIKMNKERAHNLLGQRFGKLLVIEKAPNKNKDTYWKCQCDCGNITNITTRNLMSGNSTSCGCNTTSKGESKIENILKENNINYIKEYSNPTCKFIETGHLARFDFYLQDLNTIIEYDGQQHTIVGTGNYDNLEKIKQTQARDKFKNQWCKDNKIILIRIPYTHYQDICLEDLLPETSKFII